jgi:hypothetical protein
MYTLVVATPFSGKSPRSTTLGVSIFEDSVVYSLAKLTAYDCYPKTVPSWTCPSSVSQRDALLNLSGTIA